MSTQKFTRTINPLQFEALEPKRFEDLIRQLLYDFRPWRQLEATGRSGSDDGFDARGWEAQGSTSEETIDSEEEELSPQLNDRVWLIQCKREKSIGPKKLLTYLNSIATNEISQLQGIIFAACTDFSKRARDEFRKWCVDHNIAEFHLWGKAEIEDKLFLPQNDGLLFAYFGLSITIRKRTEKIRLRSQTTTKRKLKRALESCRAILIRDVEEDNYPFTDSNDDNFRWWVFSKPKLTFQGLVCVTRRYFAYLDDEGVSWDVANKINHTSIGVIDDPWRGHYQNSDDATELGRFWHEFPNRNKAWLEVWGAMPFDQILEVDEIGDEITEHPHIYVTTTKGPSSPFKFDYPTLSRIHSFDNSEYDFEAENRIEKFPEKFRKPTPDDAT